MPVINHDVNNESFERKPKNRKIKSRRLKHHKLNFSIRRCISKSPSRIYFREQHKIHFTPRAKARKRNIWEGRSFRMLTLPTDDTHEKSLESIGKLAFCFQPKANGNATQCKRFFSLSRVLAYYSEDNDGKMRKSIS